MNKQKQLIFAFLLLAFLIHTTKEIYAVELIINGGFENATQVPWITSYSGCTDNGAGYSPWGVKTTSFNPGFGGTTTPFAGTKFMFCPWTCGPTLANGVYYPAGTGFLLMYQDVVVPAGNSLTLKFTERLYTNLNFFASPDWRGARPQSYRVEIRNTSNAVLQTAYSFTAPAYTTTDIPYTSHTINLGNTYAGQTIRLAFVFTIETGYAAPGNVGLDAISLNAFIPTAANVPVGGRILTNEGGGIPRVSVTLTNSAGVSRNTTTNSFGYYKFDSVLAGETYLLTVNNKKYLFTDSPRVVNVQNELTDIDFRASP
jgi:Carboxypeptidase regulatory-like domain